MTSHFLQFSTKENKENYPLYTVMVAIKKVLETKNQKTWILMFLI